MKPKTILNTLYGVAILLLGFALINLQRKVNRLEDKSQCENVVLTKLISNNGQITVPISSYAILRMNDTIQSVQTQKLTSIKYELFDTNLVLSAGLNTPGTEELYVTLKNGKVKRYKIALSNTECNDKVLTYLDL